MHPARQEGDGLQCQHRVLKPHKQNSGGQQWADLRAVSRGYGAGWGGGGQWGGAYLHVQEEDQEHRHLYGRE